MIKDKFCESDRLVQALTQGYDVLFRLATHPIKWGVVCTEHVTVAVDAFILQNKGTYHSLAEVESELQGVIERRKNV